MKHLVSETKPQEIEGATVLTFYCPCCDKWIYITHVDEQTVGEFFGHPEKEKEELQKQK